MGDRVMTYGDWYYTSQPLMLRSRCKLTQCLEVGLVGVLLGTSGFLIEMFLTI